MYQYLTTTVTDEETGEEQTVITEYADEAALDKQVENMLNEDGSPKRISSLSSISIIRLTPVATPRTARNLTINKDERLYHRSDIVLSFFSACSFRTPPERSDHGQSGLILGDVSAWVCSNDAVSSLL